MSESPSLRRNCGKPNRASSAVWQPSKPNYKNPNPSDHRWERPLWRVPAMTLEMSKCCMMGMSRIMYFWTLKWASLTLILCDILSLEILNWSKFMLKKAFVVLTMFCVLGFGAIQLSIAGNPNSCEINCFEDVFGSCPLTLYKCQLLHQQCVDACN